MIIADIETICFAKLIKTFEYHLEIVVFFCQKIAILQKTIVFCNGVIAVSNDYAYFCRQIMLTLEQPILAFLSR